MKKILSTLSVTLMMLFASSCDDKLDIVPKGQSTLDNIDDLETLLNQQFVVGYVNHLEGVANSILPATWETPTQTLAAPNTLNYAIMTGDENVDRAALATDDSRYERFYKYINYMNVVISKAPESSGTDSKKQRVIAEARVLRGWFHFLLVNIYARQYDAATAESLGGVAYVDNTNVNEQKTKLSIAQVYERILEDCSDEVIALLSPQNLSAKMRGGADWGNAVRSAVLFQMKRYDEALTYAQKALAIHSVVEDRSTVMQTGLWKLDYLADNNYLLIRSNNSNLGEYYGISLTKETNDLLEPNDFVMLLGEGAGWSDNYGYGPAGCYMCAASDIHYNSWGLRTENMLYNAAECLIRGGKIKDGLEMIDRVKRYRINNYAPLAENTSITTEAQAMKVLQDSKRIEMLATCYNFFDRKRWNTESVYSGNMIHQYDDNGPYVITPESAIWVFPFPLTATLYNSSLTQNY
ncbi:MAG: RagB/SusD family nutrient uptake outer membrane protein [Duncaniella sp.]|nr:RagB/SusD family nutrient uptake outer membrane protein [Duncaniella sp.]MDE6813293.1 RagB/SusD family nutrient uptake outer membrane protein [Duncaniella sp.]MDE6824085.1 RagB/SusD family nutrient uptake outer membrane protein [Duncaniella sp.]